MDKSRKTKGVLNTLFTVGLGTSTRRDSTWICLQRWKKPNFQESELGVGRHGSLGFSFPKIPRAKLETH